MVSISTSLLFLLLLYFAAAVPIRSFKLLLLCARTAERQQRRQRKCVACLVFARHSVINNRLPYVSSRPGSPLLPPPTKGNYRWFYYFSLFFFLHTKAAACVYVWKKGNFSSNGEPCVLTFQISVDWKKKIYNKISPNRRRCYATSIFIYGTAVSVTVQMARQALIF